LRMSSARLHRKESNGDIEHGRSGGTSRVVTCDVVRRGPDLACGCGLAVGCAPDDNPPGFRAHSLNLVAKNKIAQKLLTLLPPGGTIGLDSSTTVYCLGPLLPENGGITVVTNGLSVFQYHNEKPAIRSYLTGGEREHQNNSLVGQLAINSLENFHLDCCFISALSVHSESGTSETTLAQAAMKHAMVRASERTVLALDATKLETRSRVRSLTLDRIDVLVTELAPSDARLDAYRESVKTIV